MIVTKTVTFESAQKKHPSAIYDFQFGHYNINLYFQSYCLCGLYLVQMLLLVLQIFPSAYLLNFVLKVKVHLLNSTQSWIQKLFNNSSAHLPLVGQTDSPAPELTPLVKSVLLYQVNAH